MIYTITLAPSLDHHIYLKEFSKGKLNISNSTSLKAGGKGINVSKYLSNAGIENSPFFSVGGKTGGTFLKILSSCKCNINKCHIFKTSRDTRINVKLHIGNKVTEINSQVGKVSPYFIDFIKRFPFEKDDVIAICGSVPSNTSADIYADIISLKKESRIYLDTSGEALKRAISKKFYLLKINNMEYECIKDKKINAENIIITSEKGATLITQDRETFFETKRIKKPLQTIGAGDIFLGALIEYHEVHKKPLSSAIKYANIKAGEFVLGKLLNE